jgi:hypothetical protein
VPGWSEGTQAWQGRIGPVQEGARAAGGGRARPAAATMAGPETSPGLARRCHNCALLMPVLYSSGSLGARTPYLAPLIDRRSGIRRPGRRAPHLEEAAAMSARRA